MILKKIIQLPIGCHHREKRKQGDILLYTSHLSRLFNGCDKRFECLYLFPYQGFPRKSFSHYSQYKNPTIGTFKGTLCRKKHYQLYFIGKIPLVCPCSNHQLCSRYLLFDHAKTTAAIALCLYIVFCRQPHQRLI